MCSLILNVFISLTEVVKDSESSQLKKIDLAYIVGFLGKKGYLISIGLSKPEETRRIISELSDYCAEHRC
jgi:hypothetical protein